LSPQLISGRPQQATTSFFSAFSRADFRPDAFFTSNNMCLQVIDVCSSSRCSLGLEQQLLLLQAQFECGAGPQALDDIRWVMHDFCSADV
jgi:hypothetical protein